MTALKSDLAPSSAADLALVTAGNLADTAAPTAAEINAGGLDSFRLECWIVGDNPLSITRNAEMQSVRSACDSESYDVPTGILNDPISFRIWRYIANPTSTDVAWSLFDDTVIPRASYYLVDCPAGFTGTLNADGSRQAAAGDIVDVYTCVTASRSKAPRSGSELQTGDVIISVLATSLDVAVV